MKKLHLVLIVLVLGLSALSGCGGSQNTMPPPPGMSSVSLTVTDTPPLGAGILSFEVTLSGAVLMPGSVDLLNGKTPRIEVKKLETEDAFLNTANVPPGTYTSIALTFSNPEVTFMNGTGATLAGCAVGAICEIKPTGTLTSTFTFPGSGVTIGSSTPSALRVDINPNNILTAALGVDFSVAGSTTVTQLTAPPANKDLDDLDDLRGMIQNLDTTNKKFDLVTTTGTFHITTDANTRFDIDGEEKEQDTSSSGCAANNFSCLANGQVVQVDAMLQTDGSFLAKKIEFEDDVEDDELEGVVSKIDDATHFELVTLEELRDIPNVSVGNPVKVALASSPCTGCFQVKSDGLTVPSTLLNAFTSATDTSQLIPGQAIQIRLKGAITPATSTSPALATADRVRLRMTQFSAKVSAAGSPNFTVNTLPAFFAPATSVLVETQSATNFDGAAGASSLAIGDTVSLSGLLFSSGTPATPDLIAKKVRKR